MPFSLFITNEAILEWLYINPYFIFLICMNISLVINGSIIVIFHTIFMPCQKWIGTFPLFTVRTLNLLRTYDVRNYRSASVSTNITLIPLHWQAVCFGDGGKFSGRVRQASRLGVVDWRPGDRASQSKLQTEYLYTTEAPSSSELTSPSQMYPPIFKFSWDDPHKSLAVSSFFHERLQ